MQKSRIQWPLYLSAIVVLVFAGFIGLSPSSIELGGEASAARTARPDTHGQRFGLTVSELTAIILRELGLPARTHGVIVSVVQPGSIAEEAGLRTGDVIQQVNQKAVANVAKYEEAMQGVDTMVMFLINRKGRHAYVALEGPAEPAR